MLCTGKPSVVVALSFSCFLGLEFGITRPAAAEAPLFAGNLDIAAQMLHGDAHLLILGDSIQSNKMIPSYLSQWHPDRYSGQVISPNLCSDFGQVGVGDSICPWFTAPWIASTSPNQLPDQPASADGYTGLAPAATSRVVFAAAPVDPYVNFGSNRFLQISLDSGQQNLYAGGPWTYANAGHVNVDVLLYGNPQGLATGMQLDIHDSAGTMLATVPLSTYSPTAGWMNVPVSFTYQPADPGAGFYGEFHLAEGITPAANSNFIFGGARVSTGQSGMQIANAAQGSKGVDYFLSTDNVSADNLAQYLELTDTNIAYIWIGANDNGRYDKDQWKAQMEGLLDRYRAARPGMKFVLVSNYDLSWPRCADFSQDLNEIANESTDVLFLNLYAAAGSFSYLDQNYLVDHVHPTAAGDLYFADQVWSLVEQAAAPVPEPASAALLAFGSLLLLRGRGRRCARIRS